MQSVLNVGEKPSQAKTIAGILSNGNLSATHTDSKFNPVWQFQCQVQGQQSNMFFTSLSGHLMNHEFPPEYSNWRQTDPALLLKEAQVLKKVSKDKTNIAQNIKRLAQQCQKLIIWTDCDREGENMAYEIVIQAKSTNRNIQVLRGQFSSMERSQIMRAMNNLVEPDKQQSDAVDARSEIDLRIGAAFTRFQSLSIRYKFQETSELVSYGPCQFPCMGFVVDRYREIRDFKSEKFWFINMKYEWVDKQQNKQVTNFNWDRNKLFDEQIAAELYIDSFTPVEGNQEPVPLAKVIDIKYINKQKYKPYPLTTVMLSKRGTGILRTSGSSIMDHAEKLYQKGFISYPRTETNVFPPSMTCQILKGFIEQQKQSEIWGNYASSLVDQNMYQRPGNGRQDDKAHPPIHPIKFMSKSQAENDLQYKVYELIVRYFLGCCSKNAQGDETTMTVAVKDELFVTKGLVIKEYNYLEVFIYDKWGESSVPNLQLNQQFFPSIYLLDESKTTPPKPLTEGELIGLMEKNGIGTDATMNEHIKKVQERKYIQKQNQYFNPSALGVALVEVYEILHHPLGLPDLRAWMETLFKEICEGRAQKNDVINTVMEVMIEIFNDLTQKKQDFFDYMCDKLTHSNGGGGGLGEGGSELIKSEQFGKCNSCSNPTFLYTGHQRKIGCETCNIYYQIPKNGELEYLNDICPLCNHNIIKINTVNASYTLCQKCYTNPPEEFRISEQYMACYKCKNSNCSYAQGFLDQCLYKCPSCKQGDVKAKQTKDKSKYFIGCSKFPNCKFSVFLSSDIIKIDPQQNDCQNCKKKNITSKITNVSLKSTYSQSQNMAMLLDQLNMSTNNFQMCFYPKCDQFQDEVGYSISNFMNQNNNNSFNNNNNNNKQRSNTFNQTQLNINNNSLGRTLTNNLNTLSLQNKNRNQSLDSKNNANTFGKNNTVNEFKCFKCGDPGHLANKCTQKNINGQQNYNQNNQQTNTNSTIKCFKCNQPGHFANMCTQGNNVQQSTTNNTGGAGGNTCFKCGDPNHFANKCPNQQTNFNNNNNNNNNKNKMPAANNNQSKGCKVCGKARHGKNDNCAGKKNYTKKNNNNQKQQFNQNFQQSGGVDFEM